MKKVFALVVLAGSLSLFACENTADNHDADNTTDSTVNVNTDVTVTDTTTTTPTDTTGGNNGGTMGADTANKTTTTPAH